MTLAEIQIQIKNQVAKIEEQQKVLLDSQQELSLLLEKKKIMEQAAYEKIKEAAQLLREAQADLEFTNEDILDITKSKMMKPEGQEEDDDGIDILEEYNQDSLVLGSIKIDLGKSGFSITDDQQELVNALNEKLEDFEFALSRLPVEERNYARVKLENIIGNFINH
jgi:HD superfamily phosphohydrolase